MKSNTYFFPGLWSFVNRAAGNRDIPHMGRAREIWHFREIHESLAHIPKLENREEQRVLVAHALQVKESLAVILRGIDEAIGEVTEKFDLYDK